MPWTWPHDSAWGTDLDQDCFVHGHIGEELADPPASKQNQKFGVGPDPELLFDQDNSESSLADVLGKS